MNTKNTEFRKGQLVRLISQPDGSTSQDYPVTVGAIYEVVDLAGSCLLVTTDEAGVKAFIWRGRFERYRPDSSGPAI